MKIFKQIPINALRPQLFKILCCIVGFLGLQAIVVAQNIEVNGSVQILTMDTDSTYTKILVLQEDSTLAVREVETLRDCPDCVQTFYLGQDTLGGIVYYVYTGSDLQTHGLIVSKTETSAKWQNSSSFTGAGRSWDGVYNTDQMTNSPAKNWITTNFSSDWFLPSIDELSILWHNRFYVAEALNQGGFTSLNGSGIYFSSTENGSSLVYAFQFFTGDTNRNFAKSQEKRVRAVRAF